MNRGFITAVAVTISFFISSAVLYASALDVKQASVELRESAKEMQAVTAVCENYLTNIDTIHRYAKASEVDPAIILALIKLESDFDVNANSGSNFGLMQINEVHLHHLEDRMDALDLDVNVQIGASILGEISKQSDSLHYIANCYNMGTYGYEDYVRETGQISREYSRRAIELVKGLE